MRVLALALVLAACTAQPPEPVTQPAAPRRSTAAVMFVDTIDDAPATHIAVGGKLRVRAGDFPTDTSASGPFAVVTAGELVVITATGPGTGEIEIETAIGYTRFAVSAAPIASVAILPETATPGRARVALRDASGNRLVDASLRVAPGSAPVAFDRAGWDRIEVDVAASGDVLVKTDLLVATPAVVEHGGAAADCHALAMVNSLRARVSANSSRLAAGARNPNPRRTSGRM